MANALAMLTTLGKGMALRQKTLSPVDSGGGAGRGWFPVIRESFAGAWQKNVTVSQESTLAFHAVFACVTLIASDIAKLRVKLMEFDDGIWTETSNPAFSPVLRTPNPFQTRIQFWENWMLSLLTRGNTYVLKGRDDRGIVKRLFILDPGKVMPKVSDDGQVFYELQPDNLTGVTTPIIVPAREIIHDRMNPIFHPLCGVSPLYAAAMPATQGLRIQQNSVRLFANNSAPGGILTAPGEISPDQIPAMKDEWEASYGGENLGRIAVLAGGLKFERVALTAVDAQLIEQSKWSAEVVCSAFHVPPYKIGIGQMPTYNNIQALNVEYYSQCLQARIEAAELCMDEGLGIGEGVGPPPILGTEFDTENLLRMDSVTQMGVLKDGINAAVYSPNEARAKVGLQPVSGGESPYLQEQNWPLKMLSDRELPTRPPTPPAQITPPAPPEAAPKKTAVTIDIDALPNYSYAALTVELFDDDEDLRSLQPAEAA